MLLNTSHIEMCTKLCIQFVLSMDSQFLKLDDYNKYRESLSEASLEILMQSNDNMGQKIEDITDVLVSAAEKAIPNKTVTVKLNGSP